MNSGPRRSYEQQCALAHALDIIGDRWTLLLVRELMIGPGRYTDLLEGLRGIGTNLLADRLKQLEAAGVIEKIEEPEAHEPSRGYRLTALGRQLEAAVFALVRWGLLLETPRRRDAQSRPEWDIVAMRALFQPEQAQNFSGTCQFNVDGVEYFARVQNGSLDMGLGAAPDADAVVTTSRETLPALRDEALVEQLLADGKLVVEGDLDVAKRLFRCFK